MVSKPFVFIFSFLYIVRQRSNSGEGRLDATLVSILTSSADTTMDQLVKALLRLTVETKWGGVIGYLGIGGLRHSSRFRLTARALCTYLLLHQRGGMLPPPRAGKQPVINPTPQANVLLHFDWDGTRPCDHDLRLALLNEFASFASSRSYAPLASLVPLLGARLVLNTTPVFLSAWTAARPNNVSATPPSSSAATVASASGVLEEKKTLLSPGAEPGSEPGFAISSSASSSPSTPPVAPSSSGGVPIVNNSGQLLLTLSDSSWFVDELMAIIYPLVPSLGSLPPL
jgi:hypothetical protein